MLHANYLTNTDFKSGLSGWLGGGEIAYLKDDGTEGSEGDPGVTPALKLELSATHPRSIRQEFSISDHPAFLHFAVEILASADFRRSVDPRDYPDTDQSVRFVSGSDFSYFFAPNFYGGSFNTNAQAWTPTSKVFQASETDKSWTLTLSVPPAKGTIYIRGIVVEPGVDPKTYSQ